MKRLLIATTLFAAALGVGCVGTARVHGHAHVTATPTLVAIGPGVWVVEGHSEPVFYSDGYYWMYSDGVWLRSDSYAGSWVRVRTRVVPRPVVRIDRPRIYAHYHARAGARVKRGPHGRVHVRDHRDKRHRGKKRGHARDHRHSK